jgi:hypothetical protein
MSYHPIWATRIFILGGTAVVSQTVEDQLEALLP